MAYSPPAGSNDGVFAVSRPSMSYVLLVTMREGLSRGCVACALSTTLPTSDKVMLSPSIRAVSGNVSSVALSRDAESLSRMPSGTAAYLIDNEGVLQPTATCACPQKCPPSGLKVGSQAWSTIRARAVSLSLPFLLTAMLEMSVSVTSTTTGSVYSADCVVGSDPSRVK